MSASQVCHLCSKKRQNQFKKTIEQHDPVKLFIVLHKVVLTFESVGEILKCDHSNESY